jgi:hypothetical protein
LYLSQLWPGEAFSKAAAMLIRLGVLAGSINPGWSGWRGTGQERAHPVMSSIERTIFTNRI